MKIMKLIAIITAVLNLFGCRAPVPEMLDGPGMVYVDSNCRTDYANQLPFDEVEGLPYWAVAYLGEGEVGEENRAYYIEKLFSSLPEEKIEKIKSFEFEGDEWYLVIPRYGDGGEIISLDGDENSEATVYEEPFFVRCRDNVRITYFSYESREFIPKTDENGRLADSPDVWDITEYGVDDTDN